MAASQEAAARPGALALHAYDSFGTVTGQATLGVEIAEQLPDVDTVVVAVGGGGLCAGVTRGLAGARPEASVVAVEPDACPTLHLALEHGGPWTSQVGGVAADALGASRLGEIAFATVQEHATTSLLVTDEDDHRGPALAVARGAGGRRARWCDRAGRAAERAPTSRGTANGSASSSVAGTQTRPTCPDLQLRGLSALRAGIVFGATLATMSW